MMLKAVFFDMGGTIDTFRYTREQRIKAVSAVRECLSRTGIILTCSDPCLADMITAGTSDIPVAEEAALTASRMGARVERIFDVGVAGLHRLMKHLDTLRASRAIVVVAGMEGALPSVVGGLVDRPIVAVPTSVGYGVNLGGLTTLMAMLNSCVPGITVVNIDNGFGAGVAAAMINRGGEAS